jgi:hypothetical protein
MKLFQKASDGGKNSGVSAYFLIEWKRVFSIALLHFNTGTREAYHSHAFNALTLWLKGEVEEQRLRMVPCSSSWEDAAIREITTKRYEGGDWKLTTRDNMHRVKALTPAWALTFRGPWSNTWQEDRNGEIVTLTHGRKVVTS